MLTIRRMFQMWRTAQRMRAYLLESKDPANCNYTEAVILSYHDMRATPLEHLAMHETLMELKDEFIEEAIEKLKSGPPV